MPEWRNIRLPEDLCTIAEQRWAGCFNDVEDLLIFILRECADDATEQISHAEEELVEQRLRDLGYI